jgi:hypothetical protein
MVFSEIGRIITGPLDMLAERKGRAALVALVGQEWARFYPHYSDRDRAGVWEVLDNSKAPNARLAKDFADWVDYWRTSVQIPVEKRQSFRVYKELLDYQRSTWATRDGAV